MLTSDTCLQSVIIIYVSSGVESRDRSIATQTSEHEKAIE